MLDLDLLRKRLDSALEAETDDSLRDWIRSVKIREQVSNRPKLTINAYWGALRASFSNFKDNEIENEHLFESLPPINTKCHLRHWNLELADPPLVLSNSNLNKENIEKMTLDFPGSFFFAKLGL